MLFYLHKNFKRSKKSLSHFIYSLNKKPDNVTTLDAWEEKDFIGQWGSFKSLA